MTSAGVEAIMRLYCEEIREESVYPYGEIRIREPRFPPGLT
jgi:hypothetical protein